MAITPGDNGGGGSTSNVCPISPFDLQTTVNNLADRVTAIETILSQLLGVDITTIQLSDITQDMGNILGGSFGGGVLSKVVTTIGSVNGWAISGNNVLLSGDGSGGNLGASNFGGGQFIIAIGDIDEFAGDVSDAQMYSCKRTEFDPIVSPNVPYLYNLRGGGFYYNIRIAPIAENRLDTPPPRRVMCGLSAPGNDGGPIFRNSFGSENNRDDPLGLYILFQYSQPRGDATWKVIIRDQPDDGGTCLSSNYVQKMYDTGVIVSTDHIYDLSLRCEPESNIVQWSIIDQTSGSSSSGEAPAPILCEEIHEQAVDTYYSGFGIWKCEGVSAPNPTAWVHHAWCQSLEMETNSADYLTGV